MYRLTVSSMSFSLTILNNVYLLLDICLKEVPSITDSVYNVQILKEFSNEYLDKCFHLKPEDLLYAPPVLKVSPKTKKTSNNLACPNYFKGISNYLEYQ